MEKLQYIDTHTHMFENKIDFKSLDLSSIQAMIVPSYSMDNLNLTLDFCKQNKKCYCALGVHPNYIEGFNYKILETLIESNRKNIYAIGEIGLDSLLSSDYEKQKEIFILQLNLARKFNLPISVHLRTKKDFETFFSIMEQYKDLRVALHCYNGDKTDLEKSIQNGYFISFATNITYKGNVRLRELAKLVPIDKILLETDSPNMLPASFQRRGVNTSQNIHFVAEILAKVRDISLEEISNITTQNAISLFKL